MNYPKRKHPRLDIYNYSLPGCYYVTIHMLQDATPLSRIRPSDVFCKPVVELSDVGLIAQQELFALKQRYAYLEIDHYVIMPTHIHAILRLLGNADQNHQRPGLTDIICTYKSLTTREINKALQCPGKKWFQTSFYEHVIRNAQGYQECWKYIDENPAKWLINTVPIYRP